MRIASLLPATTEIAWALGLGDSVVGVTYECDTPAEAASRPHLVTSALPPTASPAELDEVVRARTAAGLPLYELDADRMRSLAPDLVLTQDLCRVCALPAADARAAIGGADVDVVSYDPHTLDDVVAGIEEIGRRAGVPERAADLVASLRVRLDAVRAAIAGRPPVRVVLLEWVDPPFVAGHWLPELVALAGGAALLSTAGARSVTVAWDDVDAAAPDVLVVAPCGVGLDEAIAQAQPLAARAPRVVAVDSGGLLVRPGPRLVEGAEALAWALHPDAFPAPPPGVVVVA